MTGWVQVYCDVALLGQSYVCAYQFVINIFLTTTGAHMHSLTQGVKGFVTLNVLVFDEELPLVEERIRQMAQAGVDAVIVQVRGGVRAMIER
jgi:collagenase-like PrtC family protease